MDELNRRQTYEQSGLEPQMWDLVEAVAVFTTVPVGIAPEELGNRREGAIGFIVEIALIHDIVVACLVDQSNEESDERGQDLAWYSPAELTPLTPLD